jgi:starvation-inducible DNA-binding protein
MDAKLGIEKTDLHKSVHILSHYLADTFFLYFKTHTFHWNVTGPNFYSLHKLFNDQYEALFKSMDEIAERIRSLGSIVSTSSPRFQSLSSLKESGEVLDDKTQLLTLLNDHEMVIFNLRKWMTELNNTNDVATVDFLTSCLAEHEKMAWMLRAHLS